MNHYVIGILLCWSSCIAGLYAQNTTVALGGWRSHLAYTTSIGIDQSEDAVFFATNEAVLKINKADQSLEYINKVMGTSDMRIQTLAYHKSEQLLILAYLNGNIDLVYDNGTIVNLPAILNNNIILDKTVYHIHPEGKKIYFSCAFGLTVYDLDIEEFSQTTFTPVEVYGCTQLNNTLYMSTGQGIYAGILDGRNLLDFTIWERQTQNLPNVYDSRTIIRFNNKVYADVDSELYVYEETNGWQTLSGVDLDTQTPFTRWQPTGNGDFINNYNFSLSYNEDLLVVTSRSPKYFLINAAQEVQSLNYPASWRVVEVAIDQEGIHWAADNGYLHRDGAYIKPNAPIHNTISDLYADENGALWVSNAPYDGIRVTFNENGFSQYKDGVWKIFDQRTYPKMDTFNDAIRIVNNPVTNKTYVSSFMSGVLEYDPATDDVMNYDQYTPNAPFEGVNGDNLRTRIQGIAVDEDGNVWMTLTETASTSMVVLRRDGTFKGFPLTLFNSGNKLGDIVIDGNGYKWIKQITGNVTVYDSGNLDDDTDDRSFLITPNNSNLPNQTITSMAVDREGAVWLGTSDGVAIFDCGLNFVFDGGCVGNRPVISQDDFNGNLLEGEEVRAIAFDGANRAWVGTNNGLFLLDIAETRYRQLAYFNEENSPLFTNEIQHLAVDDVSGYVYIATDLGLQSVRGEATGGKRRMLDCLGNVFPNPVEPGYDGPIALSDLPTNASVKITDASGRLVYETLALGGQAIWDGSDYTGRRAQSGVYFAFVTTPDGGQKGMCKILFMN